MHARFYNPQVGRFLSVDPGPSVNMGHPQGWNLYAYVEGNPMRYVDPNGEGLWDALKGFGNAFASNLSLGLYARVESDNPDFQAGQRLGDQAALVAGLYEGQQGAAAVVGAAACEAGTLGGCTPAAVPAAAAGVVAIVHGSAVSAMAGQNLAASMDNGGSGGGGKGVAGQDLPGEGKGWTKLKGDQGWRDSRGNIWKKDKLHKDHWDVSDRKGRKIREVDFNGNQIWPGDKHKNKRPPV